MESELHFNEYPELFTEKKNEYQTFLTAKGHVPLKNRTEKLKHFSGFSGIQILEKNSIFKIFPRTHSSVLGISRQEY